MLEDEDFSNGCLWQAYLVLSIVLRNMTISMHSSDGTINAQLEPCKSITIFLGISNSINQKHISSTRYTCPNPESHGGTRPV